MQQSFKVRSDTPITLQNSDTDSGRSALAISASWKLTMIRAAARRRGTTAWLARGQARHQRPDQVLLECTRNLRIADVVQSRLRDPDRFGMQPQQLPPIGPGQPQDLPERRGNNLPANEGLTVGE
jgi:hypothetical protein